MLLNDKDREWLAWLIIVGLVVISAITGVNFPIPQPPATTGAEVITAQGVSGGVTNLTGLQVAAPTTVATATPAVLIDSDGVSNLLEIRDAATPVVVVNDGGNADFAGTIQLGSGDRYPLEYASASRIAYFGVTSTFTGTTQIVSTTHGCTNGVALVLCAMVTPDDDAGDPFVCKASVSDNDVTLTAVQDDGSNATNGDTAYYIIIGN